VEPRDARALLGLAPDADGRTVRRRFRELARELHPDRGGDPAAFRALHRAYALLREERSDADAAVPRVARGRPSRPSHRTDPAAGRPALAVAERSAALRGALDAAPLTSAGAVVVRYVSVAPAARRNRLASALPVGSLSVLTLRVAVRPTDSLAEDATVVRLTARGRGARRSVTALALDGPLLGGTFTRHREDGAVSLRATPRADGSTRVARTEAVATATAALLTALRWPLDEWTPEAPAAT
jgi:hypothetical protein